MIGESGVTDGGKTETEHDQNQTKELNLHTPAFTMCQSSSSAVASSVTNRPCHQDLQTSDCSRTSFI